jgi:hypothetical protein
MKKNFFVFFMMAFKIAATNASYPEFFGASFTTTDIGNQANLDPKDPSNNYYVPAVLGLSDNVNVLMQTTSTATHFSPITNITVTNSTNSNSAETLGSVQNSYPKFYGGGLHLSLPIGYQHLGTLGISVFMPMGNLIETNSGHPFLPEYVMFHSRYRRVSSYINFAKKVTDDFSWSLGTIVGFQATAEVKTNLSLGGAPYGSWGQARSKVAPSLGLITSVFKKFDHTKIYLTYQQEMKSNLHAGVSGEITNPSLALFESGIDSMISYDPHTFRLGLSYDFGSAEVFTSLEYMMWSHYSPPAISISKAGGVIVPSSNYEKIKTKNTLNPHLGLKVQMTDRWSGGLGLAYRMTPFVGDFSGNGNSIDTNAYIIATGLQYRIVIWSKDVNLGTSVEYQKLQKLHVEKTTGQENGTAGSKIGAGGYDIAGNIISASLGVKFNF